MRVVTTVLLGTAIFGNNRLALAGGGLRSSQITSSSPQYQGSISRSTVSEDKRNLASDQHACGLCDFTIDASCKRCLRQERLIVVCGDCLYTNECFAIEAGEDAQLCKIVGVDP